MSVLSNRSGFLAASAAALAVAARPGAVSAQAADPSPMAGMTMPAWPPLPPLPAADAGADADMARVIQQLVAFNAPKLEMVTPQVGRELPSFADALHAVLSRDGKPCMMPVAALSHRVIPTAFGQLLLRVYTPAGSGPFPVVVYFHGGGFVIADLDTYDAAPRGLANMAGAVVVSVAYRKAPEHPFPAAVQDAFAAYRWVVANAAAIGGDPRRIAVAGESAGGNLATVTAIQARDHGIRPPVHQLLVYPVTDFTAKPPSFVQHASAVPLDTPALAWFGKYYLTSAAVGKNPLASPALTPNLRNLPPATIINAEIDPLRDSGALYAAKLKAAGNSVTRTLYPGTTHEFFGMYAAVAKAQTAMQQAARSLRSAFGTA